MTALLYEFTSPAQQDEYWKRVARLVLRPRGMSLRAAQIVVNAAMLRIGCLESFQKQIEEAQPDVEINAR